MNYAWFLLSWLVGLVGIAAADWPTYRGDAERSGFTTDALPAKPSLAWT